jgi:CheY-like chemotaxis protein
VPKTLLAVDDSTTMRKVLEITFAGEDFRVVAADASQSALARLAEGPVAAVIDASLEGDDGYALAKELRARDPRLAIVLLASRYNPYDPGRGRDAGVDDYADKPFDTQALIDKVKKAIFARESAKPAAAAHVAPFAAPAAQPPAPPVPAAAAPRAPGPPAVPQRPIVPTQRTHTLSFEGSPLAQPPVAAPPFARTAPSGTPVVQPQHARLPHPVPGMPTAPAPAAATSESTVRTAVPPRPLEAAAAAVTGNGQLAGKLGELGLTPQQVDGVLALSREVVERVVWEVVPQLAEALIKEEIVRLTKDL